MSADGAGRKILKAEDGTLWLARATGVSEPHPVWTFPNGHFEFASDEVEAVHGQLKPT